MSPNENGGPGAVRSEVLLCNCSEIRGKCKKEPRRIKDTQEALESLRRETEKWGGKNESGNGSIIPLPKSQNPLTIYVRIYSHKDNDIRSEKMISLFKRERSRLCLITF